MKLQLLIAFTANLLFSHTVFGQDIFDLVEHKYADSDGVKIHYAKAGSGPLIVFIHGFPDFWYSWREQMAGLMGNYTVAAMDTRGYNKSDKPEGVENYHMTFLTQDVASVIKSEGLDSAIIIGHDWGGGIAWGFAAEYPEMTERLVIMNLPHLKGLTRELAKLGQQHENSQYARRFQQPNSHEAISAERLASSHADENNPILYERYLTAFQNSSADSMMNYYRSGYPREPYTTGVFAEIDRIQAPVLQFHGLADTALLPDSLNDTWKELDQDWTLVTLPGVGHWPHRDKSEMVTKMIDAWLELHQE